MNTLRTHTPAVLVSLVSAALTFLLVSAVLLLTACSGLPPEPSGSGGETGDAKPNQAEPEVEDPPQWRCAQRVPTGEYVTTIDDNFTTKALETCVYAPTSLPSDPWVAKPWWLGLPEPVQMWLEDADPELDPDDPQDMHPMFVISDPYDEAEPWKRQQPNEDDFRSGMIGQYALWPVGGVPDDGLRPPIVTASFADVNEDNLVTMVGHPFYGGRYNAYGLPCNTTTAEYSSLIAWSMHMQAFSGSANVECMAYVIWAGIDEVHPLYQHVAGDPDDRGIDATACLDNGRAYDPGVAALSSAERDGLIWLNWPEVSFIKDFLVVELQGLPFYDNLIVWLDLLEAAGFELDYWPTDPVWPYNRWSSTGVCGHPAQLKAVVVGDQQVHYFTQLGCPNAMIAVMPDFEHPDVDDVETHGWSLDGYCTYAHLVPPPAGSALTTPLDVVQVGASGSGFSGARYVDMSVLTREDLEAWSQAVSFEPVPNGYEVYSTNELGRSLLVAFGVPEYSTLLAVDDTVLTSGETDDRVSLLELGLQIDKSTAGGHFTLLVLDTEDGRRLHRYVVPTTLGVPRPE